MGDAVRRCRVHNTLRSGQRPVLIIAGAAIAAIIVDAGMGTSETVREWLMADFPTQAR